jgi:hypothetical protein
MSTPGRPVRTVSMIGSNARIPPQNSTSLAHDRIEAGTSLRNRSPNTVRPNDPSVCSRSTPNDANKRNTRNSDSSSASAASASCPAVIGPAANKSASPNSAATYTAWDT